MAPNQSSRSHCLFRQKFAWTDVLVRVGRDSAGNLAVLLRCPENDYENLTCTESTKSRQVPRTQFPLGDFSHCVTSADYHEQVSFGRRLWNKLIPTHSDENNIRAKHRITLYHHSPLSRRRLYLAFESDQMFEIWCSMLNRANGMKSREGSTTAQPNTKKRAKKTKKCTELSALNEIYESTLQENEFHVILIENAYSKKHSLQAGDHILYLDRDQLKLRPYESSITAKDDVAVLSLPFSFIKRFGVMGENRLFLLAGSRALKGRGKLEFAVVDQQPQAIYEALTFTMQTMKRSPLSRICSNKPDCKPTKNGPSQSLFEHLEITTSALPNASPALWSSATPKLKLRPSSSSSSSSSGEDGEEEENNSSGCQFNHPQRVDLCDSTIVNALNSAFKEATPIEKNIYALTQPPASKLTDAPRNREENDEEEKEDNEHPDANHACPSSTSAESQECDNHSSSTVHENDLDSLDPLPSPPSEASQSSPSNSSDQADSYFNSVLFDHDEVSTSF